ncbi:MAG TPA: 6-bladed beta-propeller [Longimicrobiales bacterium]|nr:6-bladed beta-propeller [Longimicrobiales bacterium]
MIIGEEDSLPGHLLHQVSGAFRAGYDRLVVANDGTNQILIYDLAGSLVAEVGGTGAGPGEFLSASAVFPLGSDSLVVWDPATVRMSIWSTTGEFGRTVPLDVGFAPQLEGYLGGTKYVFSLPHRIRSSTRVPWDVYSDSLELVILDLGRLGQHSLGVFPHRKMVAADAGDFGGGRMAVPLPDGAVTVVTAAKDQVFVGLPDVGRIIVFDSTGRAIREIKVPLKSYARGSDAVERSIILALDRVERKRRPAIRRYLERFPQPERYPIFDQMRVDSAGSVWVREFSASPDKLARWAVVDQEGTLMREVLLPGTIHTWQIGSDWALAHLRGEYDQEMVALFGFSAE